MNWVEGGRGVRFTVDRQAGPSHSDVIPHPKYANEVDPSK